MARTKPQDGTPREQAGVPSGTIPGLTPAWVDEWRRNTWTEEDDGQLAESD